MRLLFALAALVSCVTGYSVTMVPHSMAAAPISRSNVVAKSLNLKTKVLREKMAEKGRHRLCVFKSNKHIYAQVIDDSEHKVLVAAATVEADLKGKGLNIETAKQVGMKAAERAKEKGIEQVYFDRNGFKYHGRVAALADGAREAGLVF